MKEVIEALEGPSQSIVVFFERESVPRRKCALFTGSGRSTTEFAQGVGSNDDRGSGKANFPMGRGRGGEDEMKEKVEKALEKIRPALQADGGNIELVDVVGWSRQSQTDGSLRRLPNVADDPEDGRGKGSQAAGPGGKKRGDCLESDRGSSDGTPLGGFVMQIGFVLPRRHWRFLKNGIF